MSLEQKHDRDIHTEQKSSRNSQISH